MLTTTKKTAMLTILEDIDNYEFTKITVKISNAQYEIHRTDLGDRIFYEPYLFNGNAYIETTIPEIIKYVQEIGARKFIME